MNKLFVTALLAGSVLAASAQVPVDLAKYPDYSVRTNPDPALMHYGANARGRAIQPLSERPDHVNNGRLKYFPPVFNQVGGSCGSASRICYMFTYELAAFRDLDASLDVNNYPSHFVWLWTNSNKSGKDEFVQHVGVPNSALYGGRTNSARFGVQDTADDDFGWTTGYDIWYSAMFNRMLAPTHFSSNLGTPEGREAVKNYLWNHNGDPDFRGVGGIVGLGVASFGEWSKIASTEANDAAGVTGLSYVLHWGQQIDHAVTMVGYDDRVEFDLNGNGIYGEEEADERGAWIIVNSWGAGWPSQKDGGFIYCPYAYAGSRSVRDESTGKWSFSGDWWAPEIYNVRKNYRPLRTLRFVMDYSHRSEISLSAGVTDDLTSDVAKATVALVPFQYAGDGNFGNTNPAPAMPMLGRWADGKPHYEPIEVGYDLTDLTSQFDRSKTLKYFFTVDTRLWGAGEGKIHEASLIDYEDDAEGIEMPFDFGDDSHVEIKSAGNRTVISVVVPGLHYYAPVNASVSGDILSWQAPRKGSKTLTGYAVSKDNRRLTTLGAGVSSHNISAYGSGTYAVTAIYEGGHESTAATARTAVAPLGKRMSAVLSGSGFTVPDIFKAKYNQATIEYWIKPNTVSNWNQSVGSWGSFMIHANNDGRIAYGWDTQNRNYASGLTPGKWTHVAIVVDGNQMTAVVNGRKRNSVTTAAYSGIGGFGNLVFGTSTANNHMDCEIAELRIWDRALTPAEINAGRSCELSGEAISEHLLAYYRGDLFEADGSQYLRDCVGGHHAAVFAEGASQNTPADLTLDNEEGELSVVIADPGEIIANIPASLTASWPITTKAVEWNIPGAGIKSLRSPRAEVTFAKAGEYAVSVTAFNAAGESVTADTTVTVVAAPAPNASFTMSKTEAALGERIGVKADHPRDDCSYSWQMPGAGCESSSASAAGFAYETTGTYDITLTVTSADGRVAKSTRSVNITLKAPEADFTVSPAVVVKGDTVRLSDKSKWYPATFSWIVSSGTSSYVGNFRNLSFVTETPGVYDVTLRAGNSAGTGSSTRSRAFIVTNADSRNGLIFTPAGASVTASKPLAASRLTNATVEWWMNPGNLTTYSQGLGTGKLMIKTTAEGSLIVGSGKDEVYTHDGCVIAGQWHHYAVVFHDGGTEVYRDGVLFQSLKSIGLGDATSFDGFSIGTAEAPFTGAIDELRVWSKRLEANSRDLGTKLRTYANAPLEGDLLDRAKADGLILYYDFNQSGGDVIDRSGNGATGVRNGFGPEGDAWGLSSGVFCLDFSESASTDVTGEYLVNYRRPFTSDGTANPTGDRWTAITDWTLENADETKGIFTGAHVDSNKGRAMTFTTSWDNFADRIRNHKVYQTVTLPEGMYTFNAVYVSDFECGYHSSWIVAAPGEGLPDDATITASDASYTRMLSRDTAPDKTNSVSFTLSEPAVMSLGMIVNMGVSQCLNFERFTLERSELKQILTGDNDNPAASGIDNITVGGQQAPRGIFDLQGRRLRDASAPGIYIIDGRKVIVR